MEAATADDSLTAASAWLAAGGDQVGIDDAGDIVAGLDDLALLQPDHPVAGRLDLTEVVGDQEHGPGVSAQFLDPGVALAAELRVPGGQGLVDEQHVMALGGGDGEPQPRSHPAGVGAHRQVDEVADPREVDDVRVAFLHLVLAHPHGQAAEHHVAVAGQVIEQGRVHAQQGRVAVGVDGALLGREQAGDGAQQGGLARAVAPDHADGVAPVRDERDAADGVHLADGGAALAAEHPHESGRGRAPVTARTVDAVHHVQVVHDHHGFSHGRTSSPRARRRRSRRAG